MSKDLKIILASKDAHLQSVYAMAKDFYEESHFSGGLFSEAKRDKLAGLIKNHPDQYGLLIAMYGDEPVGFIYCVFGEGIISDDSAITTVYFYYVKKEYRVSFLGGKISVNLMKGLVKWAKQKGAKEIMVHVTSGIEIQRANQFMGKMGFKTLGANYALSLQGI